MRSDATSEARVRGEAPQALPVEGALSPYNCGEHARGKEWGGRPVGKRDSRTFLESLNSSDS